MNNIVSELREIGVAQIPGNPGMFLPGEYLVPGLPMIKGVGAKLTEALKGYTVSMIVPRQVHFILAMGPEADVMPVELLDEFEELTWWTLYQLLSWPSLELLNMIPDGTQLGCMIGFPDGDRAIRVQIDWENGHNIGFRPMDSGWTWNAGTIFAVSERF